MQRVAIAGYLLVSETVVTESAAAVSVACVYETARDAIHLVDAPPAAAFVDGTTSF